MQECSVKGYSASEIPQISKYEYAVGQERLLMTDAFPAWSTASFHTKYFSWTQKLPHRIAMV